MIGKRYLIITIVAILTSCSVIWEDRDKCTCSLSIDCSQIGVKTKTDGFNFIIIGEDGNQLHQYSYDKNEYQNKLNFFVPRQEIYISAYNSIPTNTEAETDSLYLYFNQLDCYCETVTDTIRFYKQWCTLALETTGEPLNEAYFFQITGNWNGKSIIDYTPTAGNYSCIFRAMGGNKYQIRVPRQGDDELSLKLLYSSEGKEVVLFDEIIGHLLTAKGYDWTKKNLDDVDLLYDFQNKIISVEVVSWNKGATNPTIEF